MSYAPRRPIYAMEKLCEIVFRDDKNDRTAYHDEDLMDTIPGFFFIRRSGKQD